MRRAPSSPPHTRPRLTPPHTAPPTPFLLCSPPLHPQIKCKKPLFQYNLYQECGFLCFISGCRRAQPPSGKSPPARDTAAARPEPQAAECGLDLLSLGSTYSV
eukprot:2789039-Rhodomonas_salina.1